MKKFKISSKVTLAFLVLLLLSFSLISTLGYVASSGIASDQFAQAKTESLTFRAGMLQTKLRQMEGQAAAIARVDILQRITSLRSGLTALDKATGDGGAEMKRLFVTENPFPNEREKLIKPEGAQGFYVNAHEKLQAEVEKSLKNTEFADLLLVDMDGTVLYSYRKDREFAENLGSAAFKGDGASFAFESAIAMLKPGAAKRSEVAFSGLHVDSGNSRTFFAVPIVKLGQPTGVIMVRAGETAFTDVLTTGVLENSGTVTAIVTPEGRTVSVKNGVLVEQKHGDSLSSDIGAEEMASRDMMWEGSQVRSYWRAIDFAGSRFLVAEIVPQATLIAGSLRIAAILSVIGLGALVVTGLVTFVLMRKMFSPLTRLAVATKRVAAGDLDVQIADQDRGDEIGTLAQTLDSFRESLSRQRALEQSAEETRTRMEAERAAVQQDRDDRSKSLETVIQSIGDGLDRLSKSELTHRISEEFPAEMERLRQDFNRALNALGSTLEIIDQSSRSVSAGAEELRASADELAKRTERQAIAVSETATAIASMNQSITEQLKVAEITGSIADDTRRRSVVSRSVMSEAKSAMEAIQASSKEINSIIGVIDEIAFQTNLLALNAGVEAARAGEAGQGFAVVAHEVRELAQRSSSSAKEIAELLSKATGNVERGVDLVQRAAGNIEEIGGSVDTISARIEDLMRVTREDVSTLAQISHAVSEIDATTQQNAAMIEQNTAAIHKLASEASGVEERLKTFKLPSRSPGSSRPVALSLVSDNSR